MNIVDILQELEEAFPDRLPTKAKLGPTPLEDLYIRIGHQEVIRKIRGILNLKGT